MSKIPSEFPAWITDKHQKRLPPFDKDYVCNQYIRDCAPFDLYDVSGNRLNQIMQRLDMVFAARVRVNGEKHRFWLIDGEKHNKRITVSNVDKQYYDRKKDCSVDIQTLGGHAVRIVMDEERSRREIHEQFDKILD